MTFWNRLRSRLGANFRRSTQERDMDAELHFHVMAYTEDLVRNGMSRTEAARRARIEFGGIEQAKESCRDARGASLIKDLIFDLRFGLRILWKNPGFAAIAVLTLGLGIGATTAIFSVVSAVLLKPLTIKEPSRVVYVQEQWHGIFPDLSVGNFADIRSQDSSFRKLCGSHDGSFNLATEDTPERVQGEYVTADYFDVFGVQPITGRVFTAEEDQPGRAQVIIISERLWRTQLQADQQVVGRALRINGLPYTVVGVMPNGFDPLLRKTDLWTPAGFTPQQLRNHDDHYLDTIGRLKDGISLAQAQSELNVVALRLQQQYPLDNKDRNFRVMPLSSALLGDQRLALGMLLGAVGLLLLIACANIANLQLARSRIRQKEIALRAALGASSRRIVRQLLLENVVLGFVGGAFGILLAYWGVKQIVSNGPPGVPRLDQSRIDVSTLLFASGVALFSSILFGLAPALRSVSIQLSQAFKEAVGTSSGSRDRVRSLLVIGEIALALFLMTGAGLLIRSGLLVSQLNPGFDTSNLIVGRIGLSDPSFHDPLVARQTFEGILTETRALPGIQSVALVSRAPLAGGGGSNGLIPEGKSIDPSNAVNAQLQIISPSYLSTVRIPLKIGRDFTPQDTREETLVTIVNETLAQTMWPGGNPIGKRFACCESGAKGPGDPVWHEVVGVVGDVRAWGLDQQVRPEFYVPIAQMPPSAWDWIGRTMDLVMRTQLGAVPAHELQATVASVAPGVPIYQLSTMQQKIAGTLQRSHFDTFLLSIFAAAALLLSSVGIYGVMSYVVARRTRDIGIRMALGATQSQILKDVLIYGMRLTFAGLALGLAGALAGMRLLSSLLYGVNSTDAITFLVASVVLSTVALLASLVPANRATRVDPIVALRYE
jgi:putative ABC transport system permease protein